MPRSIIDWEITEAFLKFGFGDGDGPNFTDEVVAVIEAAGPYRCRTQNWGLHNYAIEVIEEKVEPGKWVLVAEFDGYTLPRWGGLPIPVRNALLHLNDGRSLNWASRQRAATRNGQRATGNAEHDK